MSTQGIQESLAIHGELVEVGGNTIEILEVGPDGAQPAFDRCCRTVELSAPSSIPDSCTAEDRSAYETLPNPIPVPFEQGF